MRKRCLFIGSKLHRQGSQGVQDKEAERVNASMSSLLMKGEEHSSYTCGRYANLVCPCACKLSLGAN